jgi:hypothetical protein
MPILLQSRSLCKHVEVSIQLHLNICNIEFIQNSSSTSPSKHTVGLTETVTVSPICIQFMHAKQRTHINVWKTVGAVNLLTRSLSVLSRGASIHRFTITLSDILHVTVL